MTLFPQPIHVGRDAVLMRHGWSTKKAATQRVSSLFWYMRVGGGADYSAASLIFEAM